jgi:hypothetical protein
MNIFLSYNRQNQAFVTEIAEKLKRFHISVMDNLFFDQDNLESGDEWAQKIQDALVNSDACLVFIGEQGIGNWQRKEVIQAINRLDANDRTFRIIPVIVPHSNREEVERSFPWYLSDTQWIEFTSPSDSDAFHKLTTTLKESAPAFPVPEGAQPYKGLRSFGVADAAFFFGRAADVNRVFYYHLRLNENPFGKRFLAIIGNSGSGKSSFASAGLLASLKAGRFAGSRDWQQVTFTPDAKPLVNLAVALEQAGIIPSADAFADNALKNPNALYTRLGVWGRQLVLLIDQFEEIVTHTSPTREQKEQENAVRKAFLANLTEAVKSSHLVCIITMRTDFYASFAPYPDFNHLLRHNNYTLTDIDADTNGVEWKRYISDIIRKPAELLKVKFENTVVNQIVNDLQPINGVLPVLQLALQQLWAMLEKPGRTENKSKIVSQDYNSLARDRGIEGIIEEHSDAVFDNLTERGTNPRRVDLFRAIFIELVEITGSKEDVRKTISLASLINKLIPRFGSEEVAYMLKELPSEKSRLIRIKADKTNQDADKFVDIIHEVLIRKWEKLKGWINEKREAIAYRQILENSIIQYEKKVGGLYGGRDLKTALNWQKHNPDLTDKRTINFIKESHGQQKKVKTIFGIVVSIILMGALGLRWYYPTYQANNSTIAQYWKDRNYKLEEVHHMDISNLDDLKYLHVFPNLKTLVIVAQKQSFTQNHLDYIPKTINELTLGDAEIIENLDFHELSNLKKLRLFSVLKFKSLAFILQTTSLQSLELDHLDILDNFKEYKSSKSIRSLTLSSVPNIYNLEILKNFPLLDTLKLENIDSLKTLKGLNAIKNLRVLKLHSLEISNLKGIEEAINLYSLKINFLSNLHNLNGLEKLKNLQFLTLEALSKLHNLNVLREIKKIRSLTIDASFIPTSIGFDDVNGQDSVSVTNLENLILTGENQRSLTLRGLQILSPKGFDGAKSLRSLVLGLPQFFNYQDLGLETYKSLRTLKLVGLDSLRDLKSLKVIKTLQSLELQNLKNLSNLEGIEGAENIISLNIYNTNKVNLKRLGQLKNLKKLELSIKSDGNLTKFDQIFYLPLDTLIIDGIDVSAINFQKEKWRAKVIIYRDIQVGEDKLVKMAKSAPGTKFLNEGYYRRIHNDF